MAAKDVVDGKSVSKALASLYDSVSSYECTRADVIGDSMNYAPSPGGNYQLGRESFSIDSNTSVKSNYSRDDYEYFNGNESNPRNTWNKILLSMRAYDRVGIIRNVIDLMADFTCKGISIVHPNVAEQKFYNEWWNYIDGPMIAERFSNYLYRMGNVPVSTSYGMVPVKIERKWTNSNAQVPYVLSPNEIKDIPITDIKYEKRRIPLKYTFINPLMLQVIAPDLAVFTGKLTFGLLINTSLRASLARLKFMFPSATYKEMVDLIPTPILAAIEDGKRLIPIDNENLSMYYYRKDDWKIWAEPMIGAILEDLVMLEKMKLADISALNGAISNVRLWNLGKMDGENPAVWQIPTRNMIAKVRSILANNVAGGTIDLVWGPDIKFTESNTQVHKFLGNTKYEPVLSNIYDGLGVPFGNNAMSKGMTNNFISMQTFVERLEYGRRVLTDFFTTEIKKVQLAMGYSKPASIVFDQVNLGDDTMYKQLLLGLVDRDLLSAESVLENFGYRDDIEKIKIKRDNKKRDAGKLAPKAGPFHNPQLDPEQDMKKIILQKGGVAPSEVGINLDPKKPGEKSPNEQQHEMQMQMSKQQGQMQMDAAKQASKFKPVGSAGRPDKAKDSQKRKTKRPPVQTKASNFTNMFIWGYAAQKKISDIVTPVLLATAYNKPNVRSLSTDEFNELEGVKFKIFSNLAPFTEVNEDVIRSIADKSKETGITENVDIVAATKLLVNMFIEQNSREPNVDEMRQIQSSGFALAYEPDDNSADLDNLDSVTPSELELSLPV
jgi:hypothetical protein